MAGFVSKIGFWLKKQDFSILLNHWTKRLRRLTTPLRYLC
jgi:hypothetical protein